ncbi:MAG TPA: NUDIX hydrolase [Candidatus Saccharimonadales bacterium]
MRIQLIAKAVVVNDKGEVLLLRRSKTAPHRPLQWDLPGGTVDDTDETYAHACAREIAEEASIAVEVKSLELTRAESVIATDGENAALTFLYYVVRLAEVPEVKLSYEHDQFKWLSLDEAIKLSEYDRQRRTLEYIRDNKLLA